MPAISTTIFKIRAHTDYITERKQKDVLSFRKGQPFYALSSDYETGLYFVSTQFSVPFARTAVVGLVPIEYFHKVDLLSKEPPVKKAVAARRPATIEPARLAPVVPNNLIPKRLSSMQPNFQIAPNQITGIRVLSSSKDNNVDMYCISVVRDKTVSIILRSISDFNVFNYAVLKAFPNMNLGALEGNHHSKLLDMETYLNYLIFNVFANANSQAHLVALTEKDKFFNPKNSDELAVGQHNQRRDSGMTFTEEESAVAEKHQGMKVEAPPSFSSSRNARKNSFSKVAQEITKYFY
jgi:hypothetical protein